MAYRVVWFKRDLRLHDHAPLAEAGRLGPVLCLYLIEPGLWARPHMAAQLHQAAPFAALHAHEETGNGWTYARDLAVGRWCREQGVAWREWPQFGVGRRHDNPARLLAARRARRAAGCCRSSCTIRPSWPGPAGASCAWGGTGASSWHRRCRTWSSSLSSWAAACCSCRAAGSTSPGAAPTRAAAAASTPTSRRRTTTATAPTEANALGHDRPLPRWFWSGDTGMACLSVAIGQSLQQAYAHHIQRLMVISL